MTALHPSIANIPMPPRMKALPLTKNGFPALFFAAKIDGEVDLRVMDPAKWRLCVNNNRCFLCGQPLGKFMCWPIGPMCVVNRVSAEPPSHRECALYALAACPFLTRPHAHRREAGMPEDLPPPPGVMLAHNPGVAALWTSRSYTLINAHNGKLISLGDPYTVEWWTEGRHATGQEVADAMERGLPRLVTMAEQDGPEAMDELNQAIARAQPLLPPILQPALPQ